MLFDRIQILVLHILVWDNFWIQVMLDVIIHAHLNFMLFLDVFSPSVVYFESFSTAIDATNAMKIRVVSMTSTNVV
jgi:hypothetical protein